MTAQPVITRLVDLYDVPAVADGDLLVRQGGAWQAQAARAALGGSPAVIDAFRDYGLKADGVSDDTSRWAAIAEDAEAETYGAQVTTPPGVSRTSAPLEFNLDNIRFVGAGQGSPKGGTVANKLTNPVYGGCVVQPLPSFTGDYVLKLWQGGTPTRALEGVFLEGFSVDGYYLPAGVNGILLQAFSGGMESVTVARVPGNAFVFEGVGSTDFPYDVFDLRLHALKADSCGGHGYVFAAGGSSDCVLSDSKGVNCGGYLIYNLSPGQQFLGFHGYFHSGTGAIYTIARSTVIAALRLSDVDKDGIVIVEDASGSGNILIDGVNARDVGKLTDNTYDLIRYAPAILQRGGKIQGVAHLTTQANRPRYGVNLASANVADCIVDPVAQSYISPASSCFATAAVNDTGTNTKLTWRQHGTRGQGLVAQNFDRQAVSNQALMIGGTAYAMLVELQEGDRISNIYVQNNAGGSGVTMFKAGIYSKDLATRYAVTADQSSLFSSSGVKTLPLTAAWQVPKTGAYMVVIVATASTTLPAPQRGFSSGAAQAIGTSAPAYATAGIGLSDLPAAGATLTNANTPISYWVGVG